MAKNTSKTSGGLIKRFIGNKNTVTVLGFLACVITLIVGYNIRVNKAINPISLPYAKVSIPSRTLITGDMIGRIKVASDYVSEATNLVKNSQEVVGKYSSYKSTIPKGSLFYSVSIKEAEEMPDAAFANIEDGYTIFSLSVNQDTTYANSIRAGDYIDLYMSATDRTEGSEENLIIFGRLIKSIRVLAVKDSNGDNILKNSLAYGTPSELLFSVEDEMFELLMASRWVSGGIELIPVIYNENYTAQQNSTNWSSEQLQDYIREQTKGFDE